MIMCSSLTPKHLKRRHRAHSISVQEPLVYARGVHQNEQEDAMNMRGPGGIICSIGACRLGGLVAICWCSLLWLKDAVGSLTRKSTPAGMVLLPSCADSGLSLFTSRRHCA